MSQNGTCANSFANCNNRCSPRERGRARYPTSAARNNMHRDASRSTRRRVGHPVERQGPAPQLFRRWGNHDSGVKNETADGMAIFGAEEDHLAQSLEFTGLMHNHCLRISEIETVTHTQWDEHSEQRVKGSEGLSSADRQAKILTRKNGTSSGLNGGCAADSFAGKSYCVVCLTAISDCNSTGSHSQANPTANKTFLSDPTATGAADHSLSARSLRQHAVIEPNIIYNGSAFPGDANSPWTTNEAEYESNDAGLLSRPVDSSAKKYGYYLLGVPKIDLLEALTVGLRARRNHLWEKAKSCSEEWCPVPQTGLPEDGGELNAEVIPESETLKVGSTHKFAITSLDQACLTWVLEICQLEFARPAILPAGINGNSARAGRSDCRPDKTAVRTNREKQNEAAQSDLPACQCWRSNATATSQSSKGGQIRLPGKLAVRTNCAKQREVAQVDPTALPELAVGNDRDKPTKEGRADPTARQDGGKNEPPEAKPGNAVVSACAASGQIQPRHTNRARVLACGGSTTKPRPDPGSRPVQAFLEGFKKVGKLESDVLSGLCCPSTLLHYMTVNGHEGVRKLNGKYKRLNRLQTVVNGNGWSLSRNRLQSSGLYVEFQRAASKLLGRRYVLLQRDITWLSGVQNPLSI
ncbi:hypothetical protein DFH06DRAFT_1370930 [Mycena polygramma]|nr:hypothetical protein DFH06DRAFT_1370930 [Mycena polygramma]